MSNVEPSVNTTDSLSLELQGLIPGWGVCDFFGFCRSFTGYSLSLPLPRTDTNGSDIRPYTWKPPLAWATVGCMRSEWPWQIVPHANTLRSFAAMRSHIGTATRPLSHCTDALFSPKGERPVASKMYYLMDPHCRKLTTLEKWRTSAQPF